ncbi:hypothetical protein DL96DRAFT_1629269 [Flagelloscypha sp. PMI_526]|nr:hypothetical protein DL96DRAFT_1629269 [Flagelloscypha sp. PMI_526]
MAGSEQSILQGIENPTLEPLESIRTPTITFKVEGHIVQLPVAPFIEHSVVFKDMFAVSTRDCGESDDNPLILQDSFRDIKVLASYFNPWLVHVNQDKEYLTSLLRLSDKYDMKKVFYDICIKLQAYELDPFEMIGLTSQFRWLPLEWAKIAFHQIIDREAPISQTEAFQIDPGFVAAIAAVREKKLRRELSDRSTNKSGKQASPVALFGQPSRSIASSTGIFGAPAPSNINPPGIFATPAPSISTPTGLFGLATPSTAPSASSGSLFGLPHPTPTSFAIHGAGNHWQPSQFGTHGLSSNSNSCSSQGCSTCQDVQSNFQAILEVLGLTMESNGVTFKEVGFF